MTDPLLTIIIVTWNSGTKLPNCLTSIYAGRLPPAQIVVIDNASSDGTMPRLQTMFPNVEAHLNQANLGHTKAVNQGFALARGEYILVLDEDTELEPDCVEKLLGFLQAHPEVAMVAPRTFNTDGTVQESARNFPRVMSGLFGPAILADEAVAGKSGRAQISRAGLSAGDRAVSGRANRRGVHVLPPWRT